MTGWNQFYEIANRHNVTLDFSCLYFSLTKPGISIFILPVILFQIRPKIFALPELLPNNCLADVFSLFVLSFSSDGIFESKSNIPSLSVIPSLV